MKLTEQYIKSKIVKKEFAVSNNVFMVCVLTLKNGYCVSGTSGCIDPMDFDTAIGKRTAYGNALDKIWELEGYLAKEMLYQRLK